MRALQINGRYRAGLLMASVLLFFLPLGREVVAKECLNFISINEQIGMAAAKNISTALTEADICHHIDYVPVRRTLLELQKDRYDGILGRAESFLSHSPVAVQRVEPAVATAVGVLVSRADNFRSVSDLTGQSLGIVRGWIWMEKLANAHENIVPVSSIAQLSGMFNDRKLDAVLLLQSWLPNLISKDYVVHTQVNLNSYIYLKDQALDSSTRISNALRHYLDSGREFFIPQKPAA